LDNNQNKIHRGELLKKVVEASGKSITDLIRKLSYNSRSTYYAHTKNADLSLDILSKYSRVLGYDFTSHLSGLPIQAAESSSPYFPEPQNLDQALIERNYWRELYKQKEKEYDALEEQYKVLLQERRSK
jgi:hypothetical protein